MKVKKETALFMTPFGSHLYGTNTPTSDYDYKVVCLPSIDDLLMNMRITNRVQKPEGWKEGDKMIEGEAEYEYIPLQIFLDHFYEGQTYAVETVFAVLQGQYTQIDKDLPVFTDLWMEELVHRFLTKNVQKMVGYAVSQSRQYGLKTQRYTSLVKASDLIRAKFREYESNYKASGSSQRIDLWPDLLEELCKIDHIKKCEVANAGGGEEMAPGIDICNKKFPLTAKWRQAIESIDKTVGEYGNRVKDHEGQPADWKALSHAIRIVEQILELCETQFIQFPRPNADLLLSVKRGEVELEAAKDLLTDRFNRIDDAVMQSALRERTPELDEKFRAFKLSLLREFYGV